jgi:hypothetical protein
MTDLQFTRDIIKFDAANMDAAEFQQFLDDNKISYEWVEVTVGDYNDGIYDVYLFDYEMPVCYISGKYIPEEYL